MIDKSLKYRLALKELVDKISFLSDQKDYENQVKLFTEDAISEISVNGNLVLNVKGRKAMQEAFSNFNKDFKSSYHFNGQQLLKIDEDQAKAKAKGICYSLITLIEVQAEKIVKTEIRAIYHDDYIFQNEQWLVSKRVGHLEK